MPLVIIHNDDSIKLDNMAWALKRERVEMQVDNKN